MINILWIRLAKFKRKVFFLKMPLIFLTNSQKCKFLDYNYSISICEFGKIGFSISIYSFIQYFRALSTIYFYRQLRRNRTEAEDYKSYALGWCAEIVWLKF
jgi:hypothetical protein